jgi:hypothetical protein
LAVTSFKRAIYYAGALLDTFLPAHIQIDDEAQLEVVLCNGKVLCRVVLALIYDSFDHINDSSQQRATSHELKVPQKALTGTISLGN